MCLLHYETVIDQVLSIKMVQTTSEAINQIIFDSKARLMNMIQNHRHHLSFCIHASLVGCWENILNHFPVQLKFEWETALYELQIGVKCYDMYIIHVQPRNDKNQDVLDELIENSQFSCPWIEQPTLFINVGSFNILQQFIRNLQLQEYILNVEEKPGICEDDQPIKIVTFDPSVKPLNILDQYKMYLRSIEGYHRTLYYYMTDSFLWQQPFMLNHFSIPIDDSIYPILFIILQHLGSLKYANELNIYDLLMLRLALCDYRDPSTGSCVRHEIDYMIKRKVTKLITNNTLDLEQYVIANNCTQREVLCDYFVYEFQNYFENININKIGRLISKSVILTMRKVSCTIELARESDVLNQLREKSNIDFDIDGRKYDGMSLSLFLDLAEFENVRVIKLDTNYRWLANVCDVNRPGPRHKLFVELFGSNTYNFIEDFVSSLKSYKSLKKTIILKLDYNLADYRILDHLNVFKIEFKFLEIDTHMLNGLHKCKLKSKMSCLECTFDNSFQNWSTLERSKRLNDVEIYEELDTWPSLFEFVLDKLVKSNDRAFYFSDDKRFHITCDGKKISLSDFMFTFDEGHSKLEIRQKHYGQLIDLYCLKINLVQDDKSDYDFYQ